MVQKQRARLVNALAAMLVFALGALLQFAGRAAAANQSVTIADFMFTPASVTVNVGDTVTWSNSGPAAHTTTADGGAWDSGRLAAGGTFAQTFRTAGTFAYHCSIHPRMVASIVVTGGTAPAATTAARAASPATAPAARAMPNTGSAGTPTADLPRMLALGAAALLLAGGLIAWRLRSAP